MLRRVVAVARARGLVPAAMSFWPSPHDFFKRETQRIYTVRQMLEGFRDCGIKRVYLPRFNAALSKQDATDFVQNVLKNTFGADFVLTGEDFRFGRNRAGDVWTLRALFGDDAQVMEEIHIDGERVSSTRIRRALSAGDLALAQSLLGKPFAFTGHVSHGDKLGRTLGFPTANIALRAAPPVSGVFAVMVDGCGEAPWPGVASIGVRPTVKLAGKPLAEVYLFDFVGDLYGKRISIRPVRKLRSEAKFASVEAMTVQMHQDLREARAVLAV